MASEGEDTATVAKIPHGPLLQDPSITRKDELRIRAQGNQRPEKQPATAFLIIQDQLTEDHAPRPFTMDGIAFRRREMPLHQPGPGLDGSKPLLTVLLTEGLSSKV